MTESGRFGFGRSLIAVVGAVAVLMAGPHLLGAGSADAETVSVGRPTAAAAATRLTPPRHYDCSAATLAIFGNSIESRMSTSDPDNLWPYLVQRWLGARPDVDGFRLANFAVPGSSIITGFFGVITMSEVVPRTLAAMSPAQRRHLVMIIDPSIVELSDTGDGTTPEQRADRAARAIVEMVRRARSSGVGNILVMPTSPVTRHHLAITVLRSRINDAVLRLHQLLRAAGVTLPTFWRSPLDDGTGFGAERYYDGFVSHISPGAIPVRNDGEHPDSDGHRAIATAMVTSGFFELAIADVCSVAP